MITVFVYSDEAAICNAFADIRVEDSAHEDRASEILAHYLIEYLVSVTDGLPLRSVKKVRLNAESPIRIHVHARASAAWCQALCKHLGDAQYSNAVERWNSFKALESKLLEMRATWCQTEHQRKAELRNQFKPPLNLSLAWSDSGITRAERLGDPMVDAKNSHQPDLVSADDLKITVVDGIYFADHKDNDAIVAVDLDMLQSVTCVCNEIVMVVGGQRQTIDLTDMPKAMRNILARSIVTSWRNERAQVANRD